jgi:HD-GYP domain-containing protein (c-di-GMP phosphodiesterase class II)
VQPIIKLGLTAPLRGVGETVPEHSIIDIAIECLLSGASERDPEEYYHCRRVEELCALTAKEMGWQSGETGDLKLAALLHHMDRSRIPESALAPNVAAYLHVFSERMNRHHGWGDPKNRHAEGASIMSLVDTFDRLVSHQRYRRPLSVDDAFAILRCDTGTDFEAAAVEALYRAYSKEVTLPEQKAA